MKIWTPLKNSKGPLGPLKRPTRRPKMHIFTHYANFLKNCSATFSLITHIASIWWDLSAISRWTPLNRLKGPSRGPQNWKIYIIFAHFDEFLKNCSATFLLITHTASISCQLSPMLIWTPLKNSKGRPGPPRRPKMHIFTHYAYFLKNCSATFFFLCI